MSNGGDGEVLRNAKRARSVFVAYPYRFGPEYRQNLDDRFAGSGIELRYANDVILNGHVMEKIRRMMSEADVSFFDVTDCNPNVMFELGYALGHDEPSFVAVQNEAVSSMSSDIAGWDTLRYSDSADLADKLYRYVSTQMVSMRVSPSYVNAQEIAARDRLRDLHFAIPPVGAGLLMLYAVPEHYERNLKDRSLLTTPPYRARDLCDVVLSGPNETRHRTFFWADGFDYAQNPAADYVEVYEGRSAPSDTERITNFRVYRSGLVTYMQRLRVGGAKNCPFLYAYMVEEIANMAFVAMSNARDMWAFPNEDRLNVGAVILHAPDLRVSEATPNFYPRGDAGLSVLGGDELWLPNEPLFVEASKLRASAKELAIDVRTALERTLVRER
jgi:hypothetical protein